MHPGNRPMLADKQTFVKEMFQSGLLVLNASTALRRSSALPVIKSCSQLVQKTLYVHLVGDEVDFSNSSRLPTVPLVQSVRNYITDFYTHASHLSLSIDIRFLISNISNQPYLNFKPHRLRHGYDVILTDVALDQHASLRSYLSALFPVDAFDAKILHSLGESAELVPNSLRAEECKDEGLESYDFVVLGGTFDRLHVGHKILLSRGCLLCDKILTVGVTDGKMNERKTLPELMQPTSDRIRIVEDFLHDVKPNISYKVVPITDIYGPAITDSSLQCLVASEETIRGWEKINIERKSKVMSELKLDVITLVKDLDHAVEEEEKVSSSTTRIRLLGTLLKSPKEKSYKKQPFVIGLTGGTASGKSSIGKRLEKLGAGIIDCDALGHRSYQPGTPTYQQVIQAFGNDVVDNNGFINRRILGSKVFGNKDMMKRLNDIVWPAIRQLATEEVGTLAEKGIDIVVLDAAVLLEAGWDKMVDEVWVAVIPKDEAIKRLVDRNQITKEQAEDRLSSQISNTDRVEHADVVLCTFWEPEVTQKQVEKAWALLQERLNSANSHL